MGGSFFLVFYEAHSIAFGWLCWSQGSMGKAICFHGSGKNDDANARYFLGVISGKAQREEAAGVRVTAAVR